MAQFMIGTKSRGGLVISSIRVFDSEDEVATYFASLRLQKGYIGRYFCWEVLEDKTLKLLSNKNMIKLGIRIERNKW